MTISLDVIGLDSALLKFARLEVAAKASEKPMAEAVGHAVLDAARQKAPVLTGALRDSLEEIEDPDGGVLVGTDIPYAPFVEFGTSNMAAEPFLRPAADSAAPQVGELAGRALNTLITAAIR